MADKTQILKHYSDVKACMTEAIEGTSGTLADQQDNKILVGLHDRLVKMNTKFQEEIERLEKDEEWDKFCIAFFGETNSGKSTLIEALRIVFKEEQRMAEIGHSKAVYDEAVSADFEAYDIALQRLQEFEAQLQSFIEQSVSQRRQSQKELDTVKTMLEQEKIQHGKDIDELKEEQQQEFERLKEDMLKKRNLFLGAAVILLLAAFILGQHF